MTNWFLRTMQRLHRKSPRREGKMSINDLPEELLENIFSFLFPSDRLKCTLISRRSAEVFNASPLMNDVWFNIRGDTMDEAEAVISNSNRRYRNVRLDKANLFEYNPAFWMKIGMSLRELKLVDCNWSSEVFYRVLVACPNLESLAIYEGPYYPGVYGDYDYPEDLDDDADAYDYPEDLDDSCGYGYPKDLDDDADGYEKLSVQSFELPTGMNLQSIQESTRNLRHLHLGFFVNADMLERMLVAMPNVSSISLSRFRQESDFLDRLPSMLETTRGITSLCLYPEITSDATWGKLWRISSNTLRELVTPWRTYFYRDAYEALVDCKMLRSLRIFLTSEIDDNLLRDILRNCSQLEILELKSFLSHDPFLSHRALMPILELTKLRELRLDLDLTTSSDPRVSNEFLRNLGGLSSLESLTLRSPDFVERIGVVYETSFQNWANLRNLRYLELHDVHWTANCLTTFPFNLRSLRKLSIYGSRSCDDGAATLAQLCESEQTIIDSAISSRPDRLRGRIESSCLESLTMIDVPLTDVGLTCIVAHHSRLKELTLWRCNNITAAGLVYLLQHEPLLEELNIEPTDDSVLKALEMLCPRLRSLDIQYCPGISRSAVDVFKSRRPKVSVRF